jgi:hypothetical protein
VTPFVFSEPRFSIVSTAPIEPIEPIDGELRGQTRRAARPAALQNDTSQTNS